MERSKLLILLTEFNARERQKFYEFVHSPFFNKNKNLQRLSEYILERYELLKSDGIDKKEVFKYLLPVEAYNEYKLNNFISDLYVLAEQFLGFQEIVNDPNIINGLVLKQLKEKNTDKNFQQYLRKSRMQQEKQPHRDEQYFYRAFRIDEQADDYFIRKAERTKDKTIEGKVKHLDLFYFTAKLKESCEMLNRQNILNIEFKNPFVEELVAFIERHYDYYISIPSISIYFQSYKTLTEPHEERHYHELIELLDQYHKLFSNEEAREMYDFAQNYCIKKINSGQSQYLRQVLKLYQRLLENGLIFEGEYLSQWDYKNIVTVGIRLKEFQLTEHFIQQYKVRLSPEFRDNAFAYNLANLYYGKGDYENALPLLQDVEYTDVYYSLGARTTLMKIFYEGNAEDVFQNITDTFNTYLYRNKLISDYQRASYNNMIRIARRALKLKINKGFYSDTQYQKKFTRIKQQIDSAEHIANVNWLKEIVAALEPKTMNTPKVD